MSIFDWTGDGQTVTHEWLVSKGFTRCRVFTNYLITWYQIFDRGNNFGITVNLDLNCVKYRVEEETRWHTIPLDSTQQIELLLSHLKNRL